MVLWQYSKAFVSQFLALVGAVILLLDLFKAHIPKLKRHIENIPHPYFWALSMFCFFVAGFQVWHDEHVMRLRAEAKPQVVFDYKNTEPYILAPEKRQGMFKKWNQWRVSVRVITDKPVDNACVFVTRLTKEGDRDFDIQDKQQVGWDRDDASFKAQTLNNADLQIVLVLGDDDGKTLTLFTPDRYLGEYAVTKPFQSGHYHMTIQVESASDGDCSRGGRAVQTKTYSLYWYGSMRDYPFHFHIEPD